VLVAVLEHLGEGLRVDFGEQDAVVAASVGSGLVDHAAHGLRQQRRRLPHLEARSDVGADEHDRLLLPAAAAAAAAARTRCGSHRRRQCVASSWSS